MIDLARYCSGRPHRVLQGPARSLVTFAPSMFNLVDKLKLVAAHDVAVLLIGETGSGKTFLARLIHELSGRHEQRFITLVCGAVPPEEIGSRLLGSADDTATANGAEMPGKLAAAGRGTLLLSEIDALSLQQQTNLLRLVESGEYEQVGSDETRISTARLVVSSRVELEELVRTGRFRTDLFYRLNTLSFHVPPLRRRQHDIEYLARKFALDLGRKHQIEVKRIEPEFVSALRRYRWPGNVRELENVIHRAVLYCGDGVLSPTDLPGAISSADPGGSPCSDADDRGLKTLEAKVGVAERRIIEESLRHHDYHRTDTAKDLGISRVTLYNKMKKFGMLSRK